MRIKDLTAYLFVRVSEDNPEHYLIEMKRLEWIFIAVRFLWVPVIFILAGLHRPDQTAVMIILGVVLGFYNIFACLFNVKIKTMANQKALGMTIIALDTLVAWGIILLFVRDFYTAAYAGFVYIIIEAAIRFGFKGSMGMAALFIIGLLVSYIYRLIAFDVRFSASGFVFWVILMTIIAIVIGAIVQEGKNQRTISERRARENALLSERHRLARELHDTVLKTLQGLALEARALSGRTAYTTPSVKETAQYIEEVCTTTGREIREAIFELRTGDNDTGFGAQVSRLVEEWRKTTGIPGKRTISGRDRAINPETARQLKRILSEALTNIHRHASAANADTALKISDKELSMEISDNGHGLERNQEDIYKFVAEGRLGIAGMKERTELLGGSFTLASTSSGTRIVVTVPLS